MLVFIPVILLLLHSDKYGGQADLYIKFSMKGAEKNEMFDC